MRPYILLLIELIGVVAVVQILSISPAIQLRRPVKFTQPNREGYAALSMIILVIVFTAIVSQFSLMTLVGMIPFQAFLPSLVIARPESFSLTGLIIQVGFMAILVAPFVVGLFRRKQPWLSVGLKKQMLKGGLQVGLALIMIVVFLRGKVTSLIYGPYTLDLLFLFLGSIIVCFAEEFIFRGFVQLRLMDWLGETKGWLAASGLFAIWSVLPLLSAPLETILITTAYRLAMGLLLGWIARRSGGIIGGWMYHTIHTWLFWL